MIWRSRTSTMWVNPAPSTFGAPSEPAATVGPTTQTGGDIASVASFAFCQRSSLQGTTIIDDVRVGSTWAGATAGPEISVQPADRTTNAGTAVTFSGPADGAVPLTYQWAKNGAPLSNGGDVSGATSSTLTLSGVTAGADAASYAVVVTNIYESAPPQRGYVDSH